MSVDEEAVKEVEKRKEYVQAVVGLVLAGALVLVALLPLVGLVLGCAVRCYRWAAG
jgi:hypothetical protein